MWGRREGSALLTRETMSHPSHVNGASLFLDGSHRLQKQFAGPSIDQNRYCQGKSLTPIQFTLFSPRTTTLIISCQSTLGPRLPTRVLSPSRCMRFQCSPPIRLSSCMLGQDNATNNPLPALRNLQCARQRKNGNSPINKGSSTDKALARVLAPIPTSLRQIYAHPTTDWYFTSHFTMQLTLTPSF